MATRVAFVMMPFASEFDDVYQSLMREPLVAAGYDVFRADDLLNQANILQDIVGSIANASLLVADLSGNNANVYYELGLAHALRRPVVLFAQDIGEVPFDLRSYRIIPYSTHFSKMNEAISYFKELLSNIDRGTVSFGSPVSDFGALEPLAVKLSQSASRDQGVGHDLGLLDFRAALEDGTEAITGVVEEVGQRLGALNPELTSVADQLNSKPPRTAKAQRALMRGLAKIIDSNAMWLRSANKRYKDALNDIGNSLNAMLSGEFPVDDDGRKNLRAFIETVRGTEAQLLLLPRH